MIQIAAEGEEFVVVADATVDGGGKEAQFQFMADNATDAGISDERERSIAQTRAVIEMNDMSEQFFQKKVFINLTIPTLNYNFNGICSR